MKRDFYQLVAVFATCACTLFCSSCASEQTINTSSKDIRYAGCKIELISFDLPQTSFCCFSGMMGDSIYCFDNVLSNLYSISVDGTVGKRRMGYGHGAGELPIKQSISVNYNQNDNSFLVMGSSYDAYLYNMNNQVKKIDLLPDNHEESYRSAKSYTFWPETIIRSDGENFYFDVKGNSEDVSHVFQENYYDEASILMKANMKTGQMEPIGRYSDFYKENKNKFRHLSRVYFDLNENNDFYVAFQMDSLIYHYDKNNNLIECFGFPGEEMDTDYTESGCGAESVVSASKKDKKRVGCYYWIKCVGNLVFRCYRKSENVKYDGMQVYEGNTLIADLKVPKNFRVIGKIGDYYVTEVICSEKKQKTGFYRFKMLSKEEAEKMKEEQKK